MLSPSGNGITNLKRVTSADIDETKYSGADGHQFSKTLANIVKELNSKMV